MAGNVGGMKDKDDTVVLAVYTFNNVQYIKEKLCNHLNQKKKFASGGVQPKDLKLIYKVSVFVVVVRMLLDAMMFIEYYAPALRSLFQNCFST